MINYFTNTVSAINNYNFIIDKIKTSESETTNVEDEYLSNFCLHFAHALIEDYGFGGASRDELLRIAKIIIAVLGNK